MIAAVGLALLAAAPLLRPTRNRLPMPTGAAPTLTATLPIAPLLSACRVTVGWPDTRPQYTPTSSPEAKP